MKMPANERGNIEGLQILRALAALMVVMFHARLPVAGGESWPRFGSAGVDIFFVISGFVMAYTTARIPAQLAAAERRHEAWQFFERRLLRIVPLYWLALVWLGKHELLSGAPSGGLIKDFFFIPHPNNSPKPWLSPLIEQGWTLNYEMFFYVVFALSMLAGARRIAVVSGVLALLGAAGLWFTWGGQTSTATDFVGIVRRFYTNDIVLEFLYGIVLQRLVLTERRPRWPRWAYLAVALACFAALAGFNETWPRGVVQGLPAAGLVWAMMQACIGWRAPVLTLLGDASYSIYLVHWMSFFWLAKPLNAAVGPSEGHPGRIATLIIANIVVATIAGVVIHLVVERPILNWSKAHFRRRHARKAALSPEGVTQG